MTSGQNRSAFRRSSIKRSSNKSSFNKTSSDNMSSNKTSFNKTSSSLGSRQSSLSALWIVFPESWKRSCPNFYAHDCMFWINPTDRD